MKDGAFPYNPFSSDVPLYDIATPLGYGLAPPVRVVSATAQNSTTVRVVFSHEMKHSDPEAEDDVTNPDNYSFEVTGGVAITAQTVDVVQESPTIVDITTNEMTNEASYTVVVSTTVRTVDEREIIPPLNEADFLGVGVRPNLVSATAELVGGNVRIRLVFDETMGSEYLSAPDSYQVAPEHIVITAVDTSANPIIYLSFSGEMRTDFSYTMTVSSGLRDVAQNPIDVRVRNFSGLGIAPRLQQAEFISPNKVRVTFNESMNTSTIGNKNNYNITGPSVVTITDVIDVGSDQATLVVLDFGQSGSYLVHCSSNITDLIGNPIDPEYDELAFEVTKETRPKLEISPPNGTIGVDPRSLVLLRFYDDPEEFSGILQSSISVSFIVEGQEISAVSNGAINLSAFSGQISGDPLSSYGITYKLIPLGNWPENRYIFGSARAKDLMNWESTFSFSFITGRASCLEDRTITPTTIENRLLDTGLSGAFRRLQELLLLKANSSGKPYANTRTILFFASIGNATVLVSDIVETEYADLALCDRISLLELYTVLQNEMAGLIREVRQTPLIEEDDRVLFLRYLQAESPVEVVCAAAALLIYLVNRVSNV